MNQKTDKKLNHEHVVWLAENLVTDIRVQILREVFSTKQIHTTGSLAEKLEVRDSVISHHINKLEQSSFLQLEKSGRYKLIFPATGLIQLIDLLQNILNGEPECQTEPKT